MTIVRRRVRAVLFKVAGDHGKQSKKAIDIQLVSNHLIDWQSITDNWRSRISHGHQ